MPEIDRDLFQGLSLLLLLIAVIALLALLATLSKATKLLREQVDRLKDLSTGGVLSGGVLPAPALGEDLESSLLAPAADTGSDENAALADVDDSAFLSEGEGEGEAPAATEDDWGTTPSEPAVAGDESGADAFAGISDSAGVEASSTPASEPVPADPFVSDEPVDPFTGETATTGGQTEDDPFAAQPVGAASAVDEDPFGASTGAAEATTQDDDEPFEQGGRWYFRRDGELLVYDETTGEWVDAEDEGSGAPVASTGSWAEDGVADADDAGSYGSTQDAGMHSDDATEAFDALESSGTETAEEPAAGGFWKCPSCGAVNGSTASTCRMCFAARP